MHTVALSAIVVGVLAATLPADTASRSPADPAGRFPVPVDIVVEPSEVEELQRRIDEHPELYDGMDIGVNIRDVPPGDEREELDQRRIESMSPDAPTGAAADEVDTPACKLDRSQPPKPGEFGIFASCAVDPYEPQFLRREEPDGDTADRARAALDELLAGPTQSERDAGYSTFFGGMPREVIADVDAMDSGAIVVVDISRTHLADEVRMPSMQATGVSTPFFEQMYQSLSQIEGVEKVRFLLDGDCEDFWLMLAWAPTCA